MNEHVASVRWNRGTDAFTEGRYHRVHRWLFDGGTTVAASASPRLVPAPWSDETAIDPEEAYVAALSSCHMLWFLALAAGRRFIVDAYEDDPIGRMSEVEPLRYAVTELVLRPRVRFDPAHAPTPEQFDALHHAAHERCFLANSVRTQIRIEAVSE